MARILIIDDDADFRATCRVTLEAADFEVSEAATPEEGFDRIRFESPDLVILDVIMSEGYEGFDLAKRIRDELKLTELPILMLTAVHEVKQPLFRFTPDEDYLPVDRLLDKPVPSDVLVAKVKDLLNLHREEPKEPL